jgi:cell division protein FtsA
VEEILDLAIQEVEDAGYRELIPAGVVITGGTALLSGMAEYIERRYGTPSRVGSLPQGIHGLRDIVESPIFATGIGLLKYAVETRDFVPSKRSRGGKGMWGKLFGWFRKFLRG